MENKEINIEEIDVIKEFPDVFPRDLPGLPPDVQTGKLNLQLY